MQALLKNTSSLSIEERDLLFRELKISKIQMENYLDKSREIFVKLSMHQEISICNEAVLLGIEKIHSVDDKASYINDIINFVGKYSEKASNDYWKALDYLYLAKEYATHFTDCKNILRKE